MIRISIGAVLGLLVAGTAVGSLPAQQTSTMGTAASDPSASASGELSGRVVDFETGEPVSGASVVLEDGARVESVTNDDGRFVLSPVSAGLHEVTVRHLAYGEHHQRLRVEGEGVGTLEIRLSPEAIALDPLMVDARSSRRLRGRASPSSRNIISREEITEAASNGLDLGDFLDREVAGIYLQPNSGIGGRPCIEFRGARRGDSRCRPPQVILDGTTVPDALGVLAYHSLEGLEEIQVVPPAEAGVRFGPNAGWGVVLLQTRRPPAPTEPLIPLVERFPRETTLVDWSVEPEPYPWVRVYSSAFVGNAVGLAAGAAVLSNCMDLDTLRFYRGDDYCGAPALLASGLALTLLPALGGGIGARLAGSTPRSKGRLGRSILYSIPVFVPGFAIAGLGAGERGTAGVEIAGMALMILGAPALNTLSDHLFRSLR